MLLCCLTPSTVVCTIMMTLTRQGRGYEGSEDLLRSGDLITEYSALSFFIFVKLYFTYRNKNQFKWKKI